MSDGPRVRTFVCADEGAGVTLTAVRGAPAGHGLPMHMLIYALAFVFS